MLQYFAEKTSFVLDYKEKYESISTVFLVCLFYCGQSKYNDCKVFLVRPAAACGRGAGARPRHHEVRGQPDPGDRVRRGGARGARGHRVLRRLHPPGGLRDHEGELHAGHVRTADRVPAAGPGLAPRIGHLIK